MVLWADPHTVVLWADTHTVVLWANTQTVVLWADPHDVVFTVFGTLAGHTETLRNLGNKNPQENCQEVFWYPAGQMVERVMIVNYVNEVDEYVIMLMSELAYGGDGDQQVVMPSARQPDLVTTGFVSSLATEKHGDGEIKRDGDLWCTGGSE